jgi:catechol 2,3-dioxygenase-like lactoylglutathione lyase family enzyme
VPGEQTGHTGVTSMFHGGITVSDMDLALRFYRDALGLELVYDRETTASYLGEVLGLEHPNIRIAFLRAGSSDPETFVELLEYRSVHRRAVKVAPWDPGAGHLCFYVADIEGIHGSLTSGGYEAHSRPVDIDSGPNEGARVFYVQDPDGHWIELFQRSTTIRPG